MERLMRNPGGNTGVFRYARN